jgi:hypothetical protein
MMSLVTAIFMPTRLLQPVIMLHLQMSELLLRRGLEFQLLLHVLEGVALQ